MRTDYRTKTWYDRALNKAGSRLGIKDPKTFGVTESVRFTRPGSMVKVDYHLALKRWYSEVEDYDWDRPFKNDHYRHFT